MIQKIDMDSQEFKDKFDKTVNFSQKVVKNREWSFNPQEDIVESVQQGLTRNKMIYGKYYCPCFMVVGQSDEEIKEATKKGENRVCPCKPAIEKEIPELGKCHCGIFCTPEHANELKVEDEAQIAVHTHSRGLSKDECEALLKQPQLDGEDLEALLEARKIGFIKFDLVDVREWMEWVNQRIIGTDYLVPTTSFYDALSQIEDKKEDSIVLYCLSGSRSAYCQQVMLQMGFAQVSNLSYGTMSFHGDYESGE